MITNKLSLVPVCERALTDGQLAKMTKLGAVVTLACVVRFASRTHLPIINENTIFQATVLEWSFSREGRDLSLTVDILSAPAIFKTGKVVLKFDAATGCCPLPPDLLA
jgi:hypothetical protein